MANDLSINRAITVDLSSRPLSEKQATVSRFEQKISEAQQNAPPTREWVRKAIRRHGAPRCPVRIKAPLTRRDHPVWRPARRHFLQVS